MLSNNVILMISTALALVISVDGGNCHENKTNFFTEPTWNKNRTCGWLAARPFYQATLCNSSDPSNAYNTCPSTCKKCFASCVDTSKTFNVHGTVRNCIWLAGRPRQQPIFCVLGKPAWTACPMTCLSCNASQTGQTSTPRPMLASAPTFAPIAHAGSAPSRTSQPSIISSPPFPDGPYITSANATERITLPHPPTPNLTESRSNCPHFQFGLSDWIDPATCKDGKMAKHFFFFSDLSLKELLNSMP
jgi:hypothetical protein